MTRITGPRSRVQSSKFYYRFAFLNCRSQKLYSTSKHLILESRTKLPRDNILPLINESLKTDSDNDVPSFRVIIVGLSNYPEKSIYGFLAEL